jgi:hypothetical protein
VAELRTRVSANVYRGRGLRDLDFTPAVARYWDYTDTNLPWAYSSEAAWESRIPAGVARVDLQTGSSDFWTNLKATCDAAAGRVLVQLDEGDHILDQFRMIGASGDPSYAFGFWFPKLAGLLGAGPDKSFLSMAANSVSQAQLDRLAGMRQADFQPNQMAMARLDSSATEPFFMGGLTVRADSQNPLTAISSDITGNVVVPQPAPHGGIIAYTGGYGTMSHVRFQGAAKAWNSQPPFEHANTSSNRGRISYLNCESDGRIAAIYDAARPRKCGVFMTNDAYESHLLDSWLHHTNVSRYAANDEGMTQAGRLYEVARSKIERIGDTRNDGKGGMTNASALGWESTNAELRVTDVIVSQDNPNTVGNDRAQHLQMTVTGNAAVDDVAGGRLRVNGGDFRTPGQPQLANWLTVRATPSHFVSDGYENTIFVYPNADGSGTRKQPWVYSGTWPPTAAQIAAAGVSPTTHYLIRNS